jgi:hypothetical protein
MIPNHKQFIEAITEKKKVSVRFYSTADSGVLDRICAPMDYGLGQVQDGLNRYWLWDYTSNTDSHILGLVPQQIVDLQMLGKVFDPTEFGVTPWPWSIPRAWDTPSGPLPVQVEHPAAVNEHSK